MSPPLLTSTVATSLNLFFGGGGLPYDHIIDSATLFLKYHFHFDELLMNNFEAQPILIDFKLKVLDMSSICCPRNKRVIKKLLC